MLMALSASVMLTASQRSGPGPLTIQSRMPEGAMVRITRLFCSLARVRSAVSK